MEKELLTSPFTSVGEVPAMISKGNVDIFVEDFIVLINECLERSIFSSEPEIAIVSPFKKIECLDEENYLWVKLLSLTFTF